MKGGILIIGSLLWDTTVNNRENWRERLDISNKRKIALPIRYGRCSSENRNYTYTMVISKNFEMLNSMGQGYFVPFKKSIDTEDRFIEEVIQFAKAEGFKGNRIAASWGSSCLKINPEASNEKNEFLTSIWGKLVLKIKTERKSNQTIPELRQFGIEGEEKSITENWFSNISNNVFKEINDVDFLLITSTAIRHRKTTEMKYPKVSEIAKAIYEGEYYEYFVRNRIEGIYTSEDKLIARILKRKYKVSLKKIRKKWA